MSKVKAEFRKKPRPRAPRRIKPPPQPPPDLPDRLAVLDISSSAVGFAIFLKHSLIWCGVINAKDLPVEARADDLALRVWEMFGSIDRTSLPTITVEAVSGRHGKAQSYAVARVAFTQGVIWARLGTIRCRRERVDEVDWMRGLKGDLRDKAKRAEWLAKTEPVYREYRERRGDPGCDASDAVALGLWRLGKIGRKSG